MCTCPIFHIPQYAISFNGAPVRNSAAPSAPYKDDLSSPGLESRWGIQVMLNKQLAPKTQNQDRDGLLYELLEKLKDREQTIAEQNKTISTLREKLITRIPVIVNPLS